MTGIPAPAQDIRQPPGFYRRRVGEMIVTALHDGNLDLPMASFVGLLPEDGEAMFTAAFRPTTPRLSVHCFLVQNADRIVLVDAGGAGSAYPALGDMRANLRAAGVTPEQVSAVLLTHMHGDHAAGLVDESGRPVFANADLLIHASDIAHWTNGENEARAPAARRSAFALARRVLPAYGERVRPFHEGDVSPGISAVHLRGHTPGHSGFLLRSGAERLLIWGDIVHAPEIQFARPDVTTAFDVEPAKAAATRQRIMASAAMEQMPVAGAHLHFPPFGHVARAGAAFRFVPEVWSPTP